MLNKILWLMGGKWLVSISSISSLFLFMGMVDAEIYGQFIIGCTICVFGDQFYNDAVENYILKRTSDNRFSIESSLKFSVSLFIKFLMPVALVLALIYLIAYKDKHILNLAFLSIIILLCQSIFYASKAFLIKFDKDKIVSVTISVTAVLAFITAFIIHKFFLYNPFFLYQLFLYLLPAIALLSIIYFYRLNELGIQDKAETAYILFQIKNVSLNIFTNRADALFIGLLFGSHEVGVYSFLKRIVQVVQEFFGGIFDKVFLSLSDGFVTNLKEKALNSQAILVVPIYFMLSVVGIESISILYSDVLWLSQQTLFLFLLGGGLFRTLILVERADKLRCNAFQSILQVRYIELLITVFSFSLIYLFTIENLAAFGIVFLLKNFISYIITAHDYTDLRIDMSYLKGIFCKLKFILLFSAVCTLALFFLINCFEYQGIEKHFILSLVCGSIYLAGIVLLMKLKIYEI